MTLITYFASLAHYHVWATQRLLEDHLTPLSDAEWRSDRQLFFGSVHGTLNHLLVAESIWYARFAEGQSPRMALDTELHADRSDLCQALIDAAARWTPWINALDATRFGGDLTYTRNNGEAVHLPFAPTLGHVFNHGTHHRGQISAALTAMGLAAPELDWVYQLQQASRET